MNSIDYLDLLMSNQKKVKDGFKFFNLKTNEQATIEDCYETIKKDLELLEILKKHYDKNSQTMSLDRFISFIIYNNDKNYNKVKEWLENDQSIQ